MTVTDIMPKYRRLRAPSEDGGVLLDPPVAQISNLLAENVALRGAACRSYDLQGRSLGQLTKLARRELLSAARNYSASYCDVKQSEGELEACPTIISGHQPELFHPGVWAKHFAADRLASLHGAVAISLLIDSDVARTSAIRVPSGAVDRPFVESIPFDRPVSGIAFEEYRVGDRELLQSFGHRAMKAIAPLVPHSMVDSFWNRVIDASQRTDQIGACFAQARHGLERSIGLTTLELPQSHVCQMESFHWFTAHLLANLPRLSEIYNSAVQEFRGAHRIRSAAHPVPDLATNNEWLEAPFWVWSEQSPARRRLFVRCAGDAVELSDLDRWVTRLAVSPEGDASDAVTQLEALAKSGVKIRTRALVTTMFARLFLGDLFIHGIGGARYDQLTDKIIREFFELPPPHFLTMSATLRLPISRADVDDLEVGRITQQLRDLKWHPDVYLEKNHRANDASNWQMIAKEKRAWIAADPTAENARQRFLKIRNCNEVLQKWLESESQVLQRRREQSREAARSESILASREYSFCLYPEENLRNLLLDNVHARL
jgi:hypothetical protein